jgi:SAM-dependent methyltransferase
VVGTRLQEWTNAVRGRPRFRGHLQPHLPADLGFYDLRLPEARDAQAALARSNGIDGFCYYHYWFRGRRLLEEAELPDASVDVVYSISTIEHIPVELLPSILAEVNRILVPGGRFVLTVDLFLDLEPFSDQTRNITGANIDVRWLVESAGLELEQGDRRELLGYPEFDPKQIMGNLFSYEYGAFYPSLAQVLVLVKPA